jgi:hypothetical protein
LVQVRGERYQWLITGLAAARATVQATVRETETVAMIDGRHEPAAMVASAAEVAINRRAVLVRSGLVVLSPNRIPAMTIRVTDRWRRPFRAISKPISWHPIFGVS